MSRRRRRAVSNPLRAVAVAVGCAAPLVSPSPSPAPAEPCTSRVAVAVASVPRAPCAAAVPSCHRVSPLPP
ncbi:hypothetical protein [Oryza sativa Japonica Group]|uniref:Uncharacterized protein n=1 Tax=Oryza sativa subsp. japonica TaxID=39947 RepID=Q5JJZ8_ORYSJ|nr:hypothetical protein [Oryza sativa Japonica Group]